MSSPLDEDMFAVGAGSSIRVFSSPQECLQWWNNKFKQVFICQWFLLCHKLTRECNVLRLSLGRCFFMALGTYKTMASNLFSSGWHDRYRFSWLVEANCAQTLQSRSKHELPETFRAYWRGWCTEVSTPPPSHVSLQRYRNRQMEVILSLFTYIYVPP